jgi:hypothetical protein
VPQQPQAPQAQPGGGFGGMESDFLSGVAGNVLRQQGQSYLQRGQAFMQSKMGFLSGSALHYHFSITPEYVRTKLLLLAAPFLKRWNYARHAEQISGGHKYLPPRQDVNAPDLYIPVMALWTYCLLLGVAALARSGPNGGFKPETIYNSVSSGSTAWLLHTLLLKVILYLLGIPGGELAGRGCSAQPSACRVAAAECSAPRPCMHALHQHSIYLLLSYQCCLSPLTVHPHHALVCLQPCPSLSSRHIQAMPLWLPVPRWQCSWSQAAAPPITRYGPTAPCAALCSWCAP